MNDIELIANKIRKEIVQMTYQSGVKGAHLGGSMSIADILAVLYGQILRYDVIDYENDTRDRLIISKAHAAVGWYAALHYAGFLSDEDIDNAMHGESHFYEHPKKCLKNGIEFSGGSLGQGLSLGMGTALALKKKKNFTSRVFVILGDGECNEGQIYEAALAIGSFKLDNVTVIIDVNNLQYDGASDDIMEPGDTIGRWKSMGYDVVEIDGHNVDEIYNALSIRTTKPVMVYAHTIKGKGISFAENETVWHTGRLTDDLYEIALKDLSI